MPSILPSGYSIQLQVNYDTLLDFLKLYIYPKKPNIGFFTCQKNALDDIIPTYNGG